MDQVLHVFLATELTPLPGRRASDDPGDLEELHSSVLRLPVNEFGAAVRDGAVRDARTIAVVRLALG